tara:strand:- start:203053 stop:203232 length:180 start_codon:yes stop_codon:yes gene_type:complete
LRDNLLTRLTWGKKEPEQEAPAMTHLIPLENYEINFGTGIALSSLTKKCTRRAKREERI